MADKNKILVEISNRHVHLSREHIDILFGEDYELNILKFLSQPEQFAAHEKITIINNEKILENVRVLGPERSETQVELSKTDSLFLNIDAPLRNSGDLTNSPGIILKGPNGKVELERGVIIPKRHLHVSDEEAEILNIKSEDTISIKISGKRGSIFEDVLVKAGPEHRLAFHLDTDEGSTAQIEKIAWGELLEDV